MMTGINMWGGWEELQEEFAMAIREDRELVLEYGLEHVFDSKAKIREEEQARGNPTVNDITAKSRCATKSIYINAVAAAVHKATTAGVPPGGHMVAFGARMWTVAAADIPPDRHWSVTAAAINVAATRPRNDAATGKAATTTATMSMAVGARAWAAAAADILPDR